MERIPLLLHPALGTSLVSWFLVPVPVSLSSALSRNAESDLEKQAPQYFQQIARDC